MKKLISLALLTVMLFAAGCGPTGGAVDLMKGVTGKLASEPNAPSQSAREEAADFALKLFRECAGEGSTLVSPLSVIMALAMTANGARGETLREMENVLGMSKDELNELCRGWLASLPNGEKCRLSLANSIWVNDAARFTANESFLGTNADYFGAGIYRTPFDDRALSAINSWVKERTDGMIKNTLDKIPPDAVMYLINALAFDAEWEDIYKKYAVRDGEFTLESGEKREKRFMHGSEKDYIEGESCTGFVKYYAGGRYAFCALLPDEGVSVSELVSSLDGGKVLALLEGRDRDQTVVTAIPIFETAYSAELSDALSAMGMPLAFDPQKADFSGLGSSEAGNIFVSRVIHKTFISVDERGTKAGAVTAVEMAPTASFEGNQPEPKYVILDRPFVYMLIDTETNLPFFIGVVSE